MGVADAGTYRQATSVVVDAVVVVVVVLVVLICARPSAQCWKGTLNLINCRGGAALA
jgi:hypothetical protein